MRYISNATIYQVDYRRDNKMIRCKYCSVINDKDTGDCDKCGAPLDIEYSIDEFSLSVKDSLDLYRYGFITKEQCVSRLQNLGFYNSSPIHVITYDDWKDAISKSGILDIVASLERRKAHPNKYSDIILEFRISEATAYLENIQHN